MKKKIALIIVLIMVVSILITSILLINDYQKKKEEERNRLEEKKLIANITSHYGKYVQVSEDSKLYINENNNFIEVGNVSKNVKLTLKDTEITKDTEYFLIDGLNMYIHYKNINPIEEYKIDRTYENYIYFNKNILTKEITSFYDYDNNLIYTINNSFDFKVLVMDDNRYGVVYNNELLYVNSNDVEKIYDNQNTTEVGKNKIMTLTYHFIYDETESTCNQSICQSFSQFESHLKYINENNYFSLRLFDLELYLDGKINIPQKSIVLTIDDGTIFDVDAIKLLEKYEVYATLFLITSISNSFDYLESDYLFLESHTHNMHNQYECAGYGSQGGGILCLDEEYVLNDLKTSQEKIGGSVYFAYPFFDFNDRAISLLKQAGFHMAFIGQYDTNGYSYPKQTDKYKVRRKTIFSSTTMNEFISYLQ